MTPSTFAVLLVARICLVGMFPLSALEKIFDWKAALAQANSSWIPGGPALLIMAILIEAITPVCIIFGWHDRAAAFLLAGFCVVTALLYHRFWVFPHFWSDPHSEARAHFWEFVKNFGLVGGLLLVVFAGTLTPPKVVLAHPLSSTYATGTGVPR